MTRSKEIVRALRAVKPILQTAEEAARNGAPLKHEFICNALHQVGESGVPVGAALVLIEDRIRPYATLNSWVARNVPGVTHQTLCHVDMQVYRHRWINELIREHSAKQ